MWFVQFLGILIVWTIYRYFFQFPEWVDEFIAKPFIQLVPILYFIKKFGGNIGFSKKRLLMQILTGFGIGVFLIIESMFVKHTMLDNFSMQLLPLFVSIATGLVEEIVFRGYFLNKIMETIENIYLANFVQTLLFVLIHVPLMIFLFHYSLNDMLLYSLQIFMLGYIFGFVRVLTGSIFPSAIAHTMWNFANVVFR
jgi:membrane protease YdiL (CAAX protease family)